MARENFLNFATTTLAGSTLTNSATSFSVTSGGGAAFPTANFLITIDTEVILIASRTSDAFTVASSGRGYDGSTAASHSVGATIQCSLAAYTLNHLWQNVADHYSPDVPPVQNGLTSGGVLTGSASSYDTEFETTGGWTLTPSGASTLTINSSMRSHLVFARTNTDNTLYTAYQSFTPGSSQAFTLTTKVSEATNFPLLATACTAEVHFFVSDTSNPSSSADSGNRYRIDIITGNGSTSGVYNAASRAVSGLYDSGGSGHRFSPSFPVSVGQTLYLRIVTDGAGTWWGYVGDGLTYFTIAKVSSFDFTPASMGFQFYSNFTSGTYTMNTAAIDFVRYSPTVEPYYGQVPE